MKKKKRNLSVLKWMGMILIVLLVGGVVFFTWSTPVTTNTDKYIYELPFKKGASYRITCMR